MRIFMKTDSKEAIIQLFQGWDHGHIFCQRQTYGYLVRDVASLDAWELGFDLCFHAVSKKTGISIIFDE